MNKETLRCVNRYQTAVSSQIVLKLPTYICVGLAILLEKSLAILVLDTTALEIHHFEVWESIIYMMYSFAGTMYPITRFNESVGDVGGSLRMNRWVINTEILIY